MMQNIIWSCKRFKDLTNEELYEIFRLRLEVFVVEQKCPYQDADDKDLSAFHIAGYMEKKDKGALAAYARILPPGISYKEVSVGRVAISLKLRRTGTGKILMKKLMEYAGREFGNTPIRISAQNYLQKFYEEFGFKRVSDEYLEDNIPHVEMLYSPAH